MMLTKQDQEDAVRMSLYNQAAILEALAILCGDKGWDSNRDELRLRASGVRQWLEARSK